VYCSWYKPKIVAYVWTKLQIGLRCSRRQYTIAERVQRSDISRPSVDSTPREVTFFGLKKPRNCPLAHLNVTIIGTEKIRTLFLWNQMSTATYPPPPPFYRLYKDYLQDPKSAPEPPPPIEGTYVLFGSNYTVKSLTRSSTPFWNPLPNGKRGEKVMIPNCLLVLNVDVWMYKVYLRPIQVSG